jgi:hypothetical protein
MAHPSFEVLLDFVENRLSQPARQQVLEHLALPCAICQAEIATIQDMIELMRDRELSEPPPAAMRRAMRLYTVLHRQPQPGRRARLIAHLVFDSRVMGGALATRGPKNERQMLYTAEALDIDLQFSPESDQHSIHLMGQVMTVDDDAAKVQGCAVSLMQEGEVLTQAITDELGIFAFRWVSPDDYELSIELPGEEVWIPSLRVDLTGPV